MRRDEALEALFTEVARWCRRSDIEDLSDGMAEILFNNEYPLRLPHEVFATLWPDKFRHIGSPAGSPSPPPSRKTWRG